MPTTTFAPAAPGSAGGGYPSAGLLSGDFTTPGALIRAAERADALADQVQTLMRVVQPAAVSMLDRLRQAGWGTQDIEAGAQRIAEIAASGDALSPDAVDGLLEELRALRDPIADAVQLGAEVQRHEAEGEAKSFQEQ